MKNVFTVEFSERTGEFEWKRKSEGFMKTLATPDITQRSIDIVSWFFNAEPDEVASLVVNYPSADR